MNKRLPTEVTDEEVEEDEEEETVEPKEEEKKAPKRRDKIEEKEKKEELKIMSEPEVSPSKRKLTRKTRTVSTSENKLDQTTKALLHMFDKAMDLLTATVNAGKINPSQGLLGMIMVADLMHGGAYVGPAADRPSLGGVASKYYQPISITQTELFPISGLNILDPIGTFLTWLGEASTTKYGQAITAEVYLNANVPHKFPKLLSDEAYAKILVTCAYLTHTDVVTKTATGIKTLVEASAIPIEALSKAAERVTPSGEQLKELKPLLSLLE